MNTRVIAYLPLVSYPDPASEGSVTRSVEMSGALSADIEARAFNIVIPRVSTPIGGLLINIPEMIRSAEEQSRKHCRSLADWARRDASRLNISFECSQEAVSPGGVGNFAASQARYFDVSILGMVKDNIVLREVAEAVIFGSGRPSILVPDNEPVKAVDHIAVAWDGSRVAARALSDARFLIGNGTRITVITVADEKPLGDKGLAQRLVASLERRGLEAAAQTLTISGASIGFALQDAAIDAGAQLLVMGAYGHSRLRDFVLGGATRDVLNNLQLPVLLSH
jgi:nucleotide-binding universal stress UspA family protein